MPKQNRNLSLDPEAIRRAERYSKLHETSVSQLVNSFLSSLPASDETDHSSLSPAVRRLFGAAAGCKGKAVKEYRRHVIEKYGQ